MSERNLFKFPSTRHARGASFFALFIPISPAFNKPNWLQPAKRSQKLSALLTLFSWQVIISGHGEFNIHGKAVCF